MTRREFAIAALLAIGFGAVALLLASSNGALGIARNDDWSFIQNAFQFHDTGIFAVAGWVQMMLIGQLVLAYPVLLVAGNSIAALQVLVAGLGVVLLLGTYVLCRSFLPRMYAVFAALSLAVGPLLATLSVSFMTDVPAASLQVLALVIAWWSMRGTRTSAPWLVVALLVALLAFSIREYSLTAILVVLAVAWLRQPTSRLPARVLAILTVLTGLLVLGMLAWRASQLTDNPSEFGLNIDGLGFQARMPLTVGLLTLPLTAWINPVAAARRAWAASRVWTLLCLIGLAGALAVSRLAFVGNYWSFSGSYTGAALGEPRPLYPGWAMTLIDVAAIYGAILIALVLALALARVTRAIRSASAVSATRAACTSSAGLALTVAFVGLYGLMFLVIPTILRVPIFDRYFVGVLALAGAVIVWAGWRAGVLWRSPALPVGALAVLTAIGLISTVSTAAVDGARWELARLTAEELDIAPGNVDGGFDWFRFQTNGSPKDSDRPVFNYTWWTVGYPGRAVCATVMFADNPVGTVAAAPDPAAPALRTRTVTVLPGLGQELKVIAGPDTCGTAP